MRRTLTAILALFSALAFTATVAAPVQAAERGRLAGKYDVHLEILEDRGDPENVGTTFDSVWRFRATCDAPDACDSVLIRPRPSGHPATARTRLDLVDRDPVTYIGTSKYVSACFDGEGGVLVENGYNTTERVRLTAHGFRNGIVDEFTGRLVLVFQPTAAGEAAGCEPDRIVASFSGQRIYS